MTSLYLIKEKEVGALKIIIIISLRDIINPGIAVDMGSLQTLKMIIIVTYSFYLFSSIFKLDKKSINRLRWVMATVAFFTIYNVFVALFFSSLPTVASFKVLSYSIVFIGILIGFANISKRFNILDRMLNYFKIIILTSLLTIPFPVAYLINGWSFQGVLNHPNMFGIFTVLFVAILLGKYGNNQKITKFDLFFLTISLLMIILTNSRTALLSTVVIICMVLFIRNIKK